MRDRFAAERRANELAAKGLRNEGLESEMTGGVNDWGFHYPIWMIEIAASEHDKTGRYPHPDEIADLPETWVNDIRQYNGLRFWHTTKHVSEKNDD